VDRSCYCYNPPDPLLMVSELESLRDEIVAANVAVITTLDDYGNAVRGRRKLYDADNGMADRVTMIKSYLASFPGKRKSNQYIEYNRAIKGP